MHNYFLKNRTLKQPRKIGVVLKYFELLLRNNVKHLQIHYSGFMRCYPTIDDKTKPSST